MLDAAILNSEGERAVIACRKRNRVTELLYDHSTAVAGADEFKRSVLLGHTVADEYYLCKDSSSSSSGCASLLREVCEFLDQMAAMYQIERRRSGMKSSSSSIGSSSAGGEDDPAARRSGTQELMRPAPLLPAHLSELRERSVRLLLLEADALRYHPEDCISYLSCVRGRMDAVGKGQTFQGAEEATTNVGSPLLRALVLALEHEACALETGMYLMPRQDGQIPELFLAADSGRKRRLGDISADGFEILDQQTAAKSSSDSSDDAYDSAEEDAFFASINRRTTVANCTRP